MPRIDRIAEHLEFWSGDYLNAQKMRSLAQKVNRGVQYAIENSKHQNISNYEVVRTDLIIAKVALKKAGIDPYSVFTPYYTQGRGLKRLSDPQTGEFKVTTSFKNFSQEQRQTIAGVFNYLAENRSMSKSNWAYHVQEYVDKPAKNTFITRHANVFRVTEKYELMMEIFETDTWQEIRKKAPYDIDQIMDAYEETKQLFDDDDVIMSWLDKSASASDFLDRMKNHIAKF